MSQWQRFLLLLPHPELDVSDESPCLVLDQFDVEVCHRVDLSDGELQHVAFEKAVLLFERIFGVWASRKDGPPPWPWLPCCQADIAVSGADFIEHHARVAPELRDDV